MTSFLEHPIALDRAGRRFGDVVAVDDVSFAVGEGTIVGLIGPSGSGKTTIIRMLTGAIAPSSGAVRVLGEDPTRFRARTRERIGLVPQNFVLYPDLTAHENVSFVAALFGMMWLKRGRRVRETLQALDLWESRGRRASQMSGGQLRRLALATALVHDPQVLFIDEPTAGIDPLLRSRVWEILRQLRDAGRTLLVTTQYVGESEHCDAVALVSRGQLLALDRPEDLRRDVYGGEVVQVHTARNADEDLFRGVSGVKSVRRRDARSVLLVVDDAGEATPRIADALASAGSSAVSIEPYVPTMDEVFETLVMRDEERRAA